VQGERPRVGPRLVRDRLLHRSQGVALRQQVAHQGEPRDVLVP
jgi:hypothetical protein